MLYNGLNLYLLHVLHTFSAKLFISEASSCVFFSVDKEYMLDIKTGTKPISFGDFSYYWIVGIKSVSVRTMLVDGKLARNEAIKLIHMVDKRK